MLTASLLRRPAPGGVANGVAKPQLTSLVDMLTILLVFLLKSFSVEGNLVAAADDLQLPESISAERPSPALNVEITTSGVNIDGRQVVPLQRVVAADSLLIDELRGALHGIALATGIEDRENEVVIQCDRRLDFSVIKKVMFTCAQASFSDFSLLVLREE